MKYAASILLLLLMSCSSLEECVQRSGNITTIPADVPAFNKIRVNRGIALVIRQGDEQEVSIVTGENLLDDITAEVADSTLILTDHAPCNWRRAYGVTTVFVTVSELKQISSHSEQKISSEGTLTFPRLHLNAVGNGTSEWHLNINNQELFIETNNVSGFYISGATQQLTAAFYDGNGPLFAQDLTATNAYIFHRSSNHLRMKVTQSLSGDIWSTGNVYCTGLPAEINVNQHFTGRLMLQ